MGSFLRRLENIKWKLAFSDVALIDTLERPLWWLMEVFLEENSLLQLVSSRDAVVLFV